MKNSIGMVEFKNIAKGIEATDGMLKASQIDLLQALPVCPGKYLVIVGGELSSVQSSVQYAVNRYEENVIDSFVIGNISSQVFPAVSGVVEIKNRNALGIIETFTAASAIEAADMAVKAAVIELIEVRIARGMGGKCFVMMTGGVSDVTAAVEAGAKRAEEQGTLVNTSVIPNNHELQWEKQL